MEFKRILKYLFFLFILIGTGFLYSFSSARNSAKKVSEIDVEFEAGENNFLSYPMVNKLLIQNNETVKNQAKSVINLYGLESQVLKNPYVEKAAVFLTIDGKLKTIVKQRTPIARIVQKNESYYVDKQGVKIPLSADFSARVLLVFGLKSDEELSEIVRFMSVVLADEFLKKEIVEIHKKRNEEYQFSMRSGKYKINFGKLVDVDLKIRKLKAFYNKAFLDKTIDNYKTINVKYHNQVVCTK